MKGDFCPNCGAPINGGDSFCTQCGCANASPDAGTGLRKLQWDANIPAVDLLKGAGMVLALAFGLVFIFIEVIAQFSGDSFIGAIIAGIARNEPTLYYAGGIIALWLLLSAGAVWAIYGRGYEASFGIEPQGVWMETRPGTRKVNKIINSLLFFLALFSGRPGGMGTAILAEAGQSASFEWTEIYRVAVNPRRHMIILRNNWRSLVRLYCTPDNYAAVLQLVETYVQKHAPQRAELARENSGAGGCAGKLLGLLAIAAGAGLIWQSPLLPDKAGVVVLALTAAAGWFTAGALKRKIAWLTGAVLLGLAISMGINAYEPLGEFYLRYYRYDTLDRMPAAAEFAASLAGMIVYAILVRRDAMRNTQED